MTWEPDRPWEMVEKNKDLFEKGCSETEAQDYIVSLLLVEKVLELSEGHQDGAPGIPSQLNKICILE